MGAGAPDNRIISIQMLRFVAAFAVLISHVELTGYHLGRYRGVELWRPELLHRGGFGVDLFFAISGFVMVLSSTSLFGANHARRRFMLRRIIRIVPLYWAVTVFVVVWGLRFGPAPSLAAVLHGLAFLPYPALNGPDFTPPLAVGWTLNFEMLFYILFALCLASSAKMTVVQVMAALAALVLVGTLFALPLPLLVWSRPIVLEFAGGMALALLHARGFALPAWARMGMVVLALVLIFSPPAHLLGLDGGWGRLLTWGVAGWLVLGATVLGPLHLRAAAAWAFGGDMSYALYLVHMPLLTAAQFVWRHFRLPYGAAHEAGFAVVMTVVSLVAAIAVHLLCERPVTQWLRRRTAHL